MVCWRIHVSLGLNELIFWQISAGTWLTSEWSKESYNIKVQSIGPKMISQLNENLPWILTGCSEGLWLGFTTFVKQKIRGTPIPVNFQPVEAEKKWPPFGRRHYPSIFVSEKLWISIASLAIEMDITGTLLRVTQFVWQQQVRTQWAHVVMMNRTFLFARMPRFDSFVLIECHRSWVVVILVNMYVIFNEEPLFWEL